MIPAPKGLAIGADAAGKYRLLYAGPDFLGAQQMLENPPKDLHQIWIFRGGVLYRTKETPTARAIRQAHLDRALQEANAAVERAKLEAERKSAEAEAAKKKAADELSARMKSEAEERERERLKRNAEILRSAAETAAQQAGQPPASEVPPRNETAADSGKRRK